MRLIFKPLLLLISSTLAVAQSDTTGSRIQKEKDIVIYQDDQFYSTFPSIVRMDDDELLVAFRRAPGWRALGEKGYTHTDPNSYLVSVRSNDDGKTWSKKPEMIFAHPFGGSQDPCMLRLSDQSILCASYGWSFVPPNAMKSLKTPIFKHGQNIVFLGGYILRSEDDGHTWSEPIVPPPSKGEVNLDLFGKPLPAYNRGAMCEGKDGRVFWATASHNSANPGKTSTHLMISEDKGKNWKYSCPIALDEKVTFNETSLYETPKGDLVAFMRTANFDDRTCIARSTDGGKTFQKWEDAGFKGHPHYALRLPDERVLLVYGYRHAPMGIRARVLNAECTNFATAEEIVLRDDGGNHDIGYPWASMIGKDRALVVYYFNKADGVRHIAGTFLKIELERIRL